jgi:hypothetical protein
LQLRLSRLHEITIILGFIYRPPNTSSSIFADEFANYLDELESLTNKNTPLLLAGNFNTNLLHTNSQPYIASFLMLFMLFLDVPMSKHISELEKLNSVNGI